MRSILFERTLKLDNDDKLPKYGRNRGDIDKRKKNYGLATAYKGSKNTDAFSDAATRAADDKYEDDLRSSSSAKSYAVKSRYPKGAKMHALRNPGGVRPELVDYDLDSDPNVKWYD